MTEIATEPRGPSPPEAARGHTDADAPSPCPGDTEVLEFVEGRLPQTDAQRLREHLDGCAACREWIANVAEELIDAPTLGTEEEPMRGAAVGRYIVLHLVGAGGMGTVWAAYDPELDRKIALKLLRTDRAREAHADRDRERMLREGQALARLNHPNVVAIHDVGTFGRELFIAMEFVAGVTLRVWRRRESPGWREILRCYCMAGEGLAAAHCVGLVHRDFKPDNVLLGDDGRARVVDFGLARAPAIEAEITATSGSLGTGSLSPAGTPAYMAPEQRIGEPLDARADQYSFARALREALFEQGDTGAPTWLRGVLDRALEREPAARWPSMDALLAALRRDPARARRRVALAIVGALSVAAVGGLASRSQAPDCAPDRDALEGAWDPTVRTAVEANLQRSPDAAITASIDVQLESYAETWVAMRAEACQAHARAEQSDALYDQRMLCLERRRSLLASVTEVLAGSDPIVAGEVEPTVAALPRIDDCADTEALAATVPLPGDAASRERIAQGYAALDRAWSRRYLLGDTASLLAPLTTLVDDARRLDHPPLEAKALSLLADLYDTQGQYAAAERALQECIRAAAAAHDDRTSGIAMIKLVALVGVGQRRFAEAELAAALAEAALVRAGSPDEDLAGLASVRAQLARIQGNLAGARDLHARAIAWLDASEGATVGERFGERSNLAATLVELGELTEAERVIHESLAMLEPELGPDHPVVAAVTQNLGLVLERQGRFDAAIVATKRARSIFAQAYGESHWQVGDCLDNLAVQEAARGDLPEARAHAEQAVAILTAALGPDHAELQDARANLGVIARDQGDCAIAAAELAAARRIAEAVHGPAGAEIERIRGLQASACVAGGIPRDDRGPSVSPDQPP